MPRFSGGFDKVYKGQTKVILTDKSKFAPKNDNFPPKGDQLPSISEQIHRNHFDPPKYVDEKCGRARPISRQLLFVSSRSRKRGESSARESRGGVVSVL